MGRFLLAGLALGFGLAIPLGLLFIGIRWYDDQRAQKAVAAKEATVTTQAVVARQATATAATFPQCTVPTKIAITNLRTFARPSTEPKDPNIPGFRRSYYAAYDYTNTCNYPVFFQLDFTVINNGRTLDTYTGGKSYIAGGYGSTSREVHVYEFTSNNEINIEVKISPIILFECQSEDNNSRQGDKMMFDCKHPVI